MICTRCGEEIPVGEELALGDSGTVGTGCTMGCHMSGGPAVCGDVDPVTGDLAPEAIEDASGA